MCSYRNTVDEIVKFVTILKEDQGFEPWNAINVNSFQDYRHQPLGQSSDIRGSANLEVQTLYFALASCLLKSKIL